MFSLVCTLNKRLSKQSWGWWFETPTRSLWRHCNETEGYVSSATVPVDAIPVSYYDVYKEGATRCLGFPSGPHFNIKTVFLRYGDSHVKIRRSPDRLMARWWYSVVCTLHCLIIIINTDVSEGITLLKCLSGTVTRVCLWVLPFLSIIFHALYGAYPFLLLWLCEYVYFIWSHHPQIGSMNHLPLFRVRSWNKMRRMSFCVLTGNHILSRMNGIDHSCQLP